MATYYPDQLQSQYQNDPRLLYAQLLQQQGQQQGPVRNPWEGISRVIASGLGKYQGDKVKGEYDTRSAGYQKTLADALTKLQGENPDMQGFSQALQANPDTAQVGTNFDLQNAMATVAAKRQAQAKLMEPFNLNPGEKRFIGNQEIASGGEKLPEGMQMGPDGPQFMPGYLAGKKDIASAGRTNVNVNTDKSFGAAVAKNVADRMDSGAQKAQSAVQTLNAAKQIDTALDSGNLITGSGANIRLNIAQLANTIGVGGNSNDEKLANTRAAMQGLARLALEGRQLMTGQGAISNAESQLAERVSGGDISLTPVEIKMLTGAAKRSSEFLIKSHNENVGRLSKDPNLSGLAPYYQVIPMPGSEPVNPSSNGGFKYLGPE